MSHAVDMIRAVTPLRSTALAVACYKRLVETRDEKWLRFLEVIEHAVLAEDGGEALAAIEVEIKRELEGLGDPATSSLTSEPSGSRIG